MFLSFFSWGTVIALGCGIDVFLAVLLFALCRIPDTYAGRFLGSKLLTSLGTLSYAIYILHSPLIFWANKIYSCNIEGWSELDKVLWKWAKPCPWSASEVPFWAFLQTDKCDMTEWTKVQVSLVGTPYLPLVYLDYENQLRVSSVQNFWNCFQIKPLSDVDLSALKRGYPFGFTSVLCFSIALLCRLSRIRYCTFLSRNGGIEV